MFDRFTEQARAALVLAETEAQGVGAFAVDSVHLATACLSQHESDAVRLLAQLDVSPDAVASRLKGESVDHPSAGRLPMSDVVKQELLAAMRLAMDTGRTMVTSAHILVAIVLVDADGEPGLALRAVGADPDRLQHGLRTSLSGEFIASGQNLAEPA